MDDLNWVHVLQPKLVELEHGVRVSRTDMIESGVFTCHSHSGNFRFGYLYKNGSNARIVYRDGNGMTRTGTTHKGRFVICFDDVSVNRPSAMNNLHLFTATELAPLWFNDEAQTIVHDELNALEQEQDEVRELVDKLQGLTVNQIRKVHALVQDM